MGCAQRLPQEGPRGPLIRVQVPQAAPPQADRQLVLDHEVERHRGADPMGNEERIVRRPTEDVEAACPAREVG